MKTIGKRAISLICALALMLPLGAAAAIAAPAAPAGRQAQAAAETLSALGVLRGVGENADGTPDFALDKSATRGEAVTEIVRLLGKEAEALAGSYSAPFTDVPEWAMPYVGYSYANGISKGYSDTLFGTDDPATATQYLTLLLRSMGYRDGADFSWDAAYALSDRLGITGGEFNASNASTPAGFTRGGMAVVTLGALSAPVRPGARGSTAAAPKTLLRSLLDEGAVTQEAIDEAGLGGALEAAASDSDGDGDSDGDSAPSPSSTPAKTPAPTPAPGGGASSGGSSGNSGSDQGATVPAAPSLVGAYSAGGVNYALLSAPAGSESYTYRFGGADAAASDVLAESGSTLVKAEIPAGSSSGELEAIYGGIPRAYYSVAFQSAGEAAPKTLYGVVPMKFSEFFHDVTGDGVPDAPDATSFAQGGAVAAPKLFIAQGTRTGNLGTPTYAQAKDMPLVDVISSATFGDTSVHFVPDANLTNNGDRTRPDADFAVTGITSVEVGVSFDLYANAKLLADAGRATAQSAGALAKMDGFTLISKVAADGAITGASGQAMADLGVYRVKYLLADGNWGGRVAPADGVAKSVKPLPGNDAASADAEPAAYGGTWGDKTTGYVIDNLEPEYAGNDYWTNFANYFYAGYITDEDGHTEPLVFLQQLFTHMAHTDFDIAVSPSRFARFANLKPSGTYRVKVLAWGFRDIDFEVELKDFVNGGAALSGSASVQVTTGTSFPISLTVTGVDVYSAADAGLYKGSAAVSPSGYSISESGGTVTLTLNSPLFAGSYQGTYSLALAADTASVASKQIPFTLVNAARPLLTANSDLSGGADGTQAAPLSVPQSANRLYFDIADFAASLVTAGRSVSSVAPAGGGAAVSGALKNSGAGTPYYIDLSVLSAGTEYTVTAISTGFNTQTYRITVT
jgi:hypothetical protein